ncbi:hypothetical protein ABT025_02440 [Streptomyces sp. NPDC002809]|uniref:hypothetical protein n=1 Tax=Streptomyces sp. NPDC002809 TaxID=3154433 RepID=UPI003329FE90
MTALRTRAVRRTAAALTLLPAGPAFQPGAGAATARDLGRGAPAGGDGWTPAPYGPIDTAARAAGAGRLG